MVGFFPTLGPGRASAACHSRGARGIASHCRGRLPKSVGIPIADNFAAGSRRQTYAQSGQRCGLYPSRCNDRSYFGQLLPKCSKFNRTPEAEESAVSAITPGLTALTRMFRPIGSAASVRVKLRSAAFEADTADVPATPVSPNQEVVKTMAAPSHYPVASKR